MRYVNKCVAAWLRGIYRIDDKFDMSVQPWPLGIAQHNERNSAKRSILLVTNILVGSNQHLKAGSFGGLEQFAILEPVPTSLRSRFDRVSYEKRTDGYRSSLIEENKH
jgi:hypothetical protein